MLSIRRINNKQINKQIKDILLCIIIQLMINQNQKSVLNNQHQYYAPHDNITINANADYFSLLCRNGPLPQKYHKHTDFLCTAIYLTTFVLMIVLVIINGLNCNSFVYEKQDDLKKDLLYGQRFFLWQLILAGCSLITLSMLLTLLALFIPHIMSIFSILTMITLCLLFTIIQTQRFFNQQQTIPLYLFKALISIIILIILIVIIIKRRQKIMNLGIFLELSAVVVRSHTCMIYMQMIVLSMVELLVWYGFANLYYAVATVKVVSQPIVNWMTKLIVVVVWLWTSGALVALADYLVTAYAVHWFYNLSKMEDVGSQVQVDDWPHGNQEEDAYHPTTDDKFAPQILTPIYKKLSHHLGTLIFGSILTYLPLYIISQIQKLLFKSTTTQPTITTLSKYCYLDTIMQYQGFITANHRIYKLRKRIKSVMPQLYMLGHIYGDFTKLALLLIGLAFVHQFVELKSNITHEGKYWIEYTVTIGLFAIGLGLQIVTNFTNLIGKCGDIVFFLYCIDLQIQRVHFTHNTTYSTPKSLWNIIKQLTIKRKWKIND